MVEAQRSDPQKPEKGSELFGDVRRRVRLPGSLTPEEAVRAVMCVLTQHLSGAESHYILELLPREARPLLERCVEHRDVKVSAFDRDELVRRVARHLDISLGDAEDITSSVLLAVTARIPRQELHAVAHLLPLDLRDLWVARHIAPPADPHPILIHIVRDAALPENVDGAGAFSAVMQVLTQALPRSEARHLVDALPADLAPLVSRALEGRPEERETLEAPELFARVRALLHVDHPEPVARAVFRSVYDYLPAPVFAHLMRQLPSSLEELWAVS